MIFARKTPVFYTIIARKIFSRIFGGPVPPPPLPFSYANGRQDDPYLTSDRGPQSWRWMSVTTSTCCNTPRANIWRISPPSNHRCYCVSSSTVASRCRLRRRSRTRDFRRDFASRRPRTSSREIYIATAANRIRLHTVQQIIVPQLSRFTPMLLSGTKRKLERIDNSFTKNNNDN